MNDEEYSKAINHQRGHKDDAYVRAADSPIPWRERSKFSGLKYYPPDPAYLFLVKVMPNENENEIVTLGATKGDEREYLKLGTVEFEVEGTPCQLAVYTAAGGFDGTLFVPFRDATSGGETYPAGRYVDMELADDDGTFVLDFNTAYSPWCAYNEQYSCVLPPHENWLAVEIRAGEKIYKELEEEN
jgi:uncharacterized protein (DUF1684 family)